MNILKRKEIAKTKHNREILDYLCDINRNSPQYSGEIIMRTVETYKADIYVGLVPGYQNNTFDTMITKTAIFEACEAYCTEVGLGITFTETSFIYTDGHEEGVIIGLINYLRLPSDKSEINYHALVLARELMKIADQERVSIVCSDYTTMLEKGD